MKALRARGAIAIALFVAVACASASAAVPARTRTIELGIRHSRFSADEVHVKRGERVVFVVVNDDPIDHELIVGPMDVQLRHENGTEAHHPPKPGEVSVPLLATATTTYDFDGPGTY
jgi:uncharacterized cupredoxin-like copper-binding protein